MVRTKPKASRMRCFMWLVFLNARSFDDGSWERSTLRQWLRSTEESDSFGVPHLAVG